MKNEDTIQSTYKAPSITDFGRVSDVTANVGNSICSDASFNGSMVGPGTSVGNATCGN